MVLVVPMYEEDSDRPRGIYYNTAAVIDADGTYLGKYRKTHIPHVKGFWEKYYFRPGNLGYPVFETAVGKVGVYICYDRHFPEGARALGLNGAEMVFIPSATSPRPVRVPVADRAAQPRGRQRLLRGHDQPGRHRGRHRRRRLLRPELLLRSARPVHRRRRRSAHDEELILRDMDLDVDPGGPPDLAVLPRSPPGRVRGPDGPNGTLRTAGMIPRGSAVRRRTAEPPDSPGSPPGGRDALRIHAQAGPHDRADDRAHPAGRGGRLRPRLAVRLATSCGAIRTRC